MSAQPYTLLDRGEQNIRLIRLSPSKDDKEQIRCTMHTTSLQKTPLYSAVSYEWGDADDQREIQVNGRSVSIRKNLWTFLDCISKQGDIADRLFWIDALCINQSDNLERSHQVSLMAQIFRGANLVMAWLGTASEESDLALRFLRQFQTALPSAKTWKIGEANAVLNLCRRRYWSRLWVLQELVLAAECMMYCGKESVSVTLLEAFLSHAAFATLNLPIVDDIPDVVVLQALAGSPATSMLQQRHREATQTSLLSRVLACSGLHCSEPNDKVYALLGISRSSGIMPDYTINTPRLLNELLRRSDAFDRCGSLKEVCAICEQLSKGLNTHKQHMIFSLDGIPDHDNLPPQRERDKYAQVDSAAGLPLWWAVAYRHPRVLQLWCLEEGCQDAIHIASEEGHEKVVQMLLDAGADVNAKNKPYSSNALQGASAEGHEKVVQMLLDAGADVNAREGYYGSALQAASSTGQEKVVQMLLDAGADINAEEGGYGSALRAASARGHEKVVQMLLDAGAKIEEGVEYGTMLSPRAASPGGDYKVAQDAVWVEEVE